MNKTQETSLPDDTSKIQKIAARTVHLGMYTTLAGTAITGLLIGLFYWLGFTEGLFIDFLTACELIKGPKYFSSTAFFVLFSPMKGYS